jgi:hypothetical protein
MDFTSFILQRYNVLYEFYLGDFWDAVSYDQMRQRPHANVNSIAWNLWHLARGEDSLLNRFLVDRPQVLDEGGWMARMNLPWRHHGSGMTFADVDELDSRIDLDGLREYASAVNARTLEIIAVIHTLDLEASLSEAQVRRVVVGEALSFSDPEGLVKNYTGWSKGKMLFTMTLTHPYQHVGEMGVIAGLLGVSFD